MRVIITQTRKQKNIEFGIPQGSIIGLLLLILFMNDFSIAFSYYFAILFADETSVFLEGSDNIDFVSGNIHPSDGHLDVKTP